MIIPFSTSAQKAEKQYLSREVIIRIGDTLIRTNILTGNLLKKPVSNRIYFWYTRGIINSNRGGYGSKLLHGEYKKFLDSKLIESGQFNEGLKNGTWKSWYLSGEIQEICFWRKGQIAGSYISYNYDNTINKYGHYYRGAFHSRLDKLSPSSVRRSTSLRNSNIMKLKKGKLGKSTELVEKDLKRDTTTLK